MTTRPDRSAVTDQPVERLVADVLVVGGGPAGTWAAIAAARAGQSVILADKGRPDAGVATAAADTGVWYVDPDQDARRDTIAGREELGGYLSDQRWMARVLDETYRRVNALTEAPRSAAPTIDRLGVRLLAHSPVLELLADADGAVAGARGLREQTGHTPYEVRAGAVVLAAGGCGFQTGAAGQNTGDGALLAVEAGADLSGMEFTQPVLLAPEFNPVLTVGFGSWARFYRADGSPLPGADGPRARSVLARAVGTEPVFGRLDRAAPQLQNALRTAQPAFFRPFDERGIDPFADLFPVTLLLQRAVRGVGGVLLRGDDCSTGVPGLFVAGDTASREVICGGFPGEDSHNAAWAIASGNWAGVAAASFAARLSAAARTRVVRPAGGVGLRPTGTPGGSDDYRDAVAAVQAEVLPYDQNYLRHGDWLASALSALDALWVRARGSLAGTGADARRAREAAALIANGRWMYAAALARTESRGVHQRSDYPTVDPAQQHRLVTGGLDHVSTRPGQRVFGGPISTALPTLAGSAA